MVMLVLNYRYGCISNPGNHPVDILGNIFIARDYFAGLVDPRVAQD